MDVIDLRDFYATGRGRLARRILRRRLRTIWPDVRGERVLGLGYAPPYLNAFTGEAERVIALMPATQGVIHWPVDAPGLTALADEEELPFPDLFFDRVVLVHALEFSGEVRPALREIWRVLSERGRLVVVVPNRRGLWARFEGTPFGHGQPYTARQLQALLRDSMFTPLGTWGALYAPPAPLMSGVAPAWERLGERWMAAVAGAVVVEAGKQIYGAQPLPARRARKRAFAHAPGGAVRRT
jgi:SAM-dependent methyltransferase